MKHFLLFFTCILAFSIAVPAQVRPGDVIFSASATEDSTRLACDGRTLLVAQYPVLFSEIGWTYGGSGTTFRIPDLRGRAVVCTGSGSGLSPRAAGQQYGQESVSLATANLPAHTHGPGTLSGYYATATATGEADSATPEGTHLAYTQSDTYSSSGGGHGAAVTINAGSTGSAGNGSPVAILPPSYVLHAFILTGK